MERLEKTDYQRAAIRIHLDGVTFYRTAYEKKPTVDNRNKLFLVMQDALKQIEDLVDGKPTS